MTKTIKIFLLLFVTVLLLTVTAFAIGLYHPQAYEGVLSKYVFKKTGYQYSTNGLSIQLSPTIITVEGLELINPEWNKNTSLLSMQRAEVELELKNLLNNKKPYWKADVSGLNVLVAENDQNQSGWKTTILANQQKPDSKKPFILKDLLSFSDINIDQAKVIQKKPELEEVIDISSLLLRRASDKSVELQGMGNYQDQSVEISGNIEINDENPAVEILNFALQAKGLGVDVYTKGEISPNNLDGAKASIKANSENLAKLEALLETTFPIVTPLNISLELQSIRGNYEASEITLQMGENILTGDVLYTPKESFVLVNLVSESMDLTSLQLENKDAQADTAATYQETEIDWTWMNALNTEVNVELGEIVLNEFLIKDIDAKFTLSNKTLAINELSARYFQNSTSENKSLFTSDLIHISATAKPLADKTLGEDIHLELSLTDKNISLSLEGHANINGIEDNALKLHANAENLDSLSEYLQMDFSSYAPLQFDAEIEASKNSMSISQVTANLGASNLTGDVKANWKNKIVNVEGDIISTLLDLSPIFSPQVDEQNHHKKESTDVSSQSSSNGKVFSDQFVNWDWLDSYDATLNLDIQKLKIKDNVFNKVTSKLDIGGGALKIQPFQASFANGNLKTNFMLNKVGENVKLNSQLNAINLSLAAIGATDDSVLEGGTTDVVMNISGQGNSLHQIASSLNGELVAEVQKGVIKNDAFEAIGTDIVLEMLTMLNPFMKEDETTELECAAVKFTAKDGVLTSNNQMAIETSKMKIVGGGVINLDSEELEIGFSPSAKKGFGVNVGSLVKFVRLGGTLKNPHPEADPVGLLKSGAAIGAAVSTGGLSLLVEGLFKRATSSGSACNQVLKEN